MRGKGVDRRAAKYSIYALEITIMWGTAVGKTTAQEVAHWAWTLQMTPRRTRHTVQDYDETSKTLALACNLSAGYEV